MVAIYFGASQNFHGIGVSDCPNEKYLSFDYE